MVEKEDDQFKRLNSLLAGISYIWHPVIIDLIVIDTGAGAKVWCQGLCGILTG
jgi:hypothetical protein